LEQVHVRRFLGRGLRLSLAAGLALAALPLLVPQLHAEDAAIQSTQTALSVQMRDQSGHTKATLQVSVWGEDGQPATGTVVLEDGGRQLAGAVLKADGRVQMDVDLAAGEHEVRAVYEGDAAHRGSVSEAADVHAEAGATPDFSVSVSPASLSLQVGQSGSVIASIKPENNSSLTAPMFVTLSCQGLPDESSCTFTPENLEILPSSCPNPSSSSCPIKSTMVVETQLGTGVLRLPRAGGNPVNWALVLPGAMGLLGLAWRRRNLFGRFAVLGFLGLVTVLGTTACNPRYNYFNHGPPPNPATPTGTYTLTISAQSNNGITAVTHTATMALTVK
jgi:hypothetical protein